MNWNDYIDKSYEWMLVCANDEGCVQAYEMQLDELRLVLIGFRLNLQSRAILSRWV